MSKIKRKHVVCSECSFYLLNFKITDLRTQYPKIINIFPNQISPINRQIRQEPTDQVCCMLVYTGDEFCVRDCESTVRTSFALCVVTLEFLSKGRLKTVDIYHSHPSVYIAIPQCAGINLPNRKHSFYVSLVYATKYSFFH